MRIIFIVLSIFVLSSCGVITTLKEDTVILDMNVHDTVLIIEEAYDHDGTILPAGIYYPDAEYTGGSVGYMRFEKTQVNLGFLGSILECVAGVSVKIIDPYNNYKIVAYNCEDPVMGIPTEKLLKFKIVPKESV